MPACSPAPKSTRRAVPPPGTPEHCRPLVSAACFAAGGRAAARCRRCGLAFCLPAAPTAWSIGHGPAAARPGAKYGACRACRPEREVGP